MHVTVIAKSPVPGRVKTRLCPPCTIQQAADVAAAALADTLDAIDEAVATMPVRRVLLLDGSPPAWVPKGYEIVEQSEGGLGERLANGFDVLGPGVILGMDTPHAVPAVIDAVQAVARGIDALGLAIDGGYWVIGLAGVDPAVFGGIEMSTPRTGIDQLQRLHELGRPVTMLPVARDIDTFADVVAVAHSDLGGRVVEVSRRLLSTVSANLLIYAVNEDARHHDEARTWLDDSLSGAAIVGFAWIAIRAFVRLSTKAGLFPSPLPVDGALDRVEAWTSAPAAVIVEPTARHLSLVRGLLDDLGTGGNLVDDAHLAALSIEHRGSVVSYDHDFGRFPGVTWRPPGRPGGRRSRRR